MASKPAIQERFGWESDIPGGPFWKASFNENFGKQVLRVFTPEEVTAWDLHSKASLPDKDKLVVLEAPTLERLQTQKFPGPPETLSHDDFENKWAASSPELGASRLAEAEKRLLHMVDVWEKRDDPEKWPHDLGSIDNLGILYWEAGRLPEAEVQFRLFIELLREVPQLGFASPVNASMMRKLTEVLGEQAKFDEALKVNEEAVRAVVELATSRFAKNEEMLKAANDEAKRKVQVRRYAQQVREISSESILL